MELKKIDSGGAWVILSSDDLSAICNALNEVCNGLDVPEFSTRMGLEREEVLELLDKVNAIYEKTLQPI